MARIPTKKETSKLIDRSAKADQRKEGAQESKGKTFVNLGQGVIPETLWKILPGKTEV